MTNYERLRNMTEAELAEWVSQRIDCPLCPVSRPICAANDTCIQAWIDYLTEEESEYLKQKKIYIFVILRIIPPNWGISGIRNQTG